MRRNDYIWNHSSEFSLLLSFSVAFFHSNTDTHICNMTFFWSFIQWTTSSAFFVVSIRFFNRNVSTYWDNAEFLIGKWIEMKGAQWWPCNRSHTDENKIKLLFLPSVCLRLLSIFFFTVSVCFLRLSINKPVHSWKCEIVCHRPLTESPTSFSKNKNK